MKSIRIVIDGNPITKPATRFAARGKKIVTWNTSTGKKTRIKNFLLDVLTHDQREELLSAPGSTIVTIDYFLPIPSSKRESDRNLMAWGLIPHTTKPDADNLTKFYADVGNGILWLDDRLICHLSLCKRYSVTPRTVITITKKEPMEDPLVPKILGQFSYDDVVLLHDLSFKLNKLTQDAEQMTEIPDEHFKEASEVIALLASYFGKKLHKIAKQLHPPAL